MGDTHTSTLIDALPSLVGVEIGAVVTGPGVVASPPTTVVAINDTAHTVTLSQATTATAAGVSITFSGPPEITNLRMGLFTASAAPLSVNTVLADLTQPTYAGYALVAVPVGTLRIDALGNRIDPLTEATFQPTGAVAPNQTAIGNFIVGAIEGVDTLIMAELLDEPFIFTGPTDGKSIKDDFYIRNLPAYGGICSTC